MCLLVKFGDNTTFFWRLDIENPCESCDSRDAREHKYSHILVIGLCYVFQGVVWISVMSINLYYESRVSTRHISIEGTVTSHCYCTSVVEFYIVSLLRPSGSGVPGTPTN